MGKRGKTSGKQKQSSPAASSKSKSASRESTPPVAPVASAQNPSALPPPAIPYASALHFPKTDAPVETRAPLADASVVTAPAQPQFTEAAPAQPAVVPQQIPAQQSSRVSDMITRDVTPPSFTSPLESTPTRIPPSIPAEEPSIPAFGHIQPPVTESFKPEPLPPYLFEIAWEVCWQLGGIYTVLRSKASTMIKRWGDRYFLIGPYNPNTAAVELEEQPATGPVRQVLDRLRDAGIPCHYGRWLINGRPQVILIDYRACYRSLDTDKYLLWKDHGISTPTNDGELNEVISFGFAVTEFFRHLTSVVTDRPILAHFHEWMGGLAVPRIAHLQLPVATVFTTHATLLGRYLASDNPNFYQQLPFLNPDEEAKHYNIFPRYQIEKAAAHAATVFTTVSEVTSFEADKLLGRHPEGILPNGLNIQRFAALHEFQNLHRQYKEKIHEFVMGHFFPSYTFDLDRTIYLFTSGRYEYRNKGMDLFIEAMARLNQRLKGVKDAPTVVSFIITRAQTRSFNVDVLQNHSMFEDLRNTCMDLKEQVGQRLFLSAARGRMPTFQELLSEDAIVRLKRVMHAWRSNRQPVIVTHDLIDDANDPVLKHLRHRGLFNAADDPVKMVFHPDFVSATSPLLSMDYEQFVRGCHMGVFPSYYEPWGYTPMESIALGLPAVTTDLSGFGAYVQRHIPDNAEQGILVLNRRTASFDESADTLADYLFNFVQLNRRQRIELRNRVERLSDQFDWSVLIGHYHDAHDLALERKGVSRMGSVEVRMI